MFFPCIIRGRKKWAWPLQYYSFYATCACKALYSYAHRHTKIKRGVTSKNSRVSFLLKGKRKNHIFGRRLGSFKYMRDQCRSSLKESKEKEKEKRLFLLLLVGWSCACLRTWITQRSILWDPLNNSQTHRHTREKRKNLKGGWACTQQPPAHTKTRKKKMMDCRENGNAATSRLFGFQQHEKKT